MTISSLEAFRDRFVLGKRSFPWRENPSPYGVWISEIMLQQTRASVVVGYFTRWMKLFPTVEAVADADLEDLIKAWEGLGYYSRVRNIKKTAEILKARGGNLPSSLQELLELPGIGSYTAGAIASFAFHQKAAAVDGNVSRVISRYYGLEGIVAKQVLEEKTLAFLPCEEPWVIMEALIELGATLCQKTPQCDKCPLKKECKALLQDKTDVIPASKKKQETICLHKQVLIIICGQEVLVQKQEEGKVLGGLTEFPSCSYRSDLEGHELVYSLFSISADRIADLPEEKQSFTRYRLDLSPSVFCTPEKKELQGCNWVHIDALTSLSFSSGHKRILQKFLESQTCLYKI